MILSGLLPAAAASPVLAAPTDLFISEYVEGSSNNKAIEIYNGTGSAVDLTPYSLQMFFNGATTAGTTIALTGMLDDGDVWIVANAGAGPAILAVGNQFNSASWYNGDDAVALAKSGAAIDVIGQIGLDPGTEWGTGPASTADNTLRRKPGIQTGDANGSDVFDPSIEWEGFAQDTFDGLGGHSITTDPAPFVTGTTPANNATDVPTNTTPTVSFSENVTLTAANIHCDDQGDKVVSISGGPQTFSLTTAAFQTDDHCTITIPKSGVSDADADDPPDNMAVDHVWSFDTVATATAQIVVNEVDYDQAGTDAAEYIELKNVGSDGVNIDTWNIQLVNGTGGGAAQYDLIDLPNVVLASGDYFVVCANAATVSNCDLDDGPDTNFIQNGVPDAVAVRNGSTIVDTVSYGGATGGAYTETTGASALDVVTGGEVGLSRCPDGVDTNNNDADFELRAISPGVANFCAAARTLSISDVSSAEGNAGTTTFTFTVSLSQPANPAGVTFDITTADDTATTADNDYVARTELGQFIGDAGSTYSFSVVVNGDTTVEPDQRFFVNVSNIVGAEAGDVQGQGTIVNDDVILVPIHEIQGVNHLSPFAGQAVSTSGIVTGKLGNGFYLQDPAPDANEATSEAIFVFTNSAPGVNVGDDLLVSGTVSEFRAGGTTSTNLTKTEIDSPVVAVRSSGNPLPPTTIVGAGGRVPPTTVIDDDATGDVETSGTFDAATDGIDFYESLESMRVQVDSPVAVGPTNGFGEIWVLADDGAGAAARTNRGGIVIRPTDFNPERIQLDDGFTPLGTSSFSPAVSVGDHFSGPAVGILDYNFGNFEINLTSPLTGVSGGITREVTTAPGLNELSVATFNVENLDAAEADSKFAALANQIVNHLLAPDVIALEEIQDNNGALNNGNVDASETLNKLIAAIDAADPAPGPVYDFRQINPVNNADGGEPGGNIRVGFLFRTDRGLAFVDRPGGDSTTPNTVVNNAGVPELQFSPGRVDPTNTAWNASRKPLAAEFTYRGQTFFLIANHFNSKGGDQPLFGRFQPPARVSEVQRHQQAQVLNSFVDSILAVDANAKIVVLGDINDFEFSETMNILTAGDTVLHDLMNGLPQDQRYSYVFEGNSQVLDHIIVSSSLLATSPFFDPVHVNAEFFDQLSDHDPSVALFTVNGAPTVDAGGPYSVVEGSSVTVSASGSDPDGDALTYEWDLDNNGLYETAGQTATFNAPAGSAPSVFTIRVRATDPGGLSGTDTATVQVTWPFTGVFAPFLNPPTENTVNAGAGVPIKFMLGGNQGLGVIAAGYPRSIEYTCGTPVDSRPTDATTPTQSIGFTYSASTGTYTYTWKTQKSWENTCRRFVLKLTDGTFHYVDVHFVK